LIDETLLASKADQPQSCSASEVSDLKISSQFGSEKLRSKNLALRHFTNKSSRQPGPNMWDACPNLNPRPLLLLMVLAPISHPKIPLFWFHLR
jgi:hypothetical protein